MTVLANNHLKFSFSRAQLLLGFLLFWISCSNQKKQYIISGNTMGTTYSIKLVSALNDINIRLIEKDIDSLLININKQMSTWDPKSEISMFNSWKSLEPYTVSDDLIYVIDHSIDISRKTNGLFDITVYDLMSIWGFGPSPRLSFPDNYQIAQVLKNSGYENIRVVNKNLIKNNKKIKLDLNAIAKGYAVDKVFELLLLKDFDNIFVEIGGEVRLKGKNIKNQNWSIGIEDPIKNGFTQNEISAILYLNSGSVATSGNYRNIVSLDGEILGHTINPKTGIPIQTDVLSVTVLSESCMKSDAWATALMVMDYETGYKKVESESDIDAIWIVKDAKDGERYFSMSGAIKINKMLYPIK
ncbi:MAG: FAD:protein FMN transferase [Candidatus Neomarinimicrobiota bacterium]